MAGERGIGIEPVDDPISDLLIFKRDLFTQIPHGFYGVCGPDPLKKSGQNTDTRRTFMIEDSAQDSIRASGATSPDQCTQDRVDSLIADISGTECLLNAPECDRVITFQQVVQIS